MLDGYRFMLLDMTKQNPLRAASFCLCLVLGVPLLGCSPTGFETAFQDWQAEGLMSTARQSRNSKDYRGSVETLKRAAEIAPKNSQVWNELCLAYQLTGEFDLAIESCQQQVNLNPTATSYNSLGWAYWPKHDYLKAASVFEIATAKSDEPIFQDHLLWSLLGAKQYEKAIPAALRLIEEIKKDGSSSVDMTSAIECLGVAYSESGQTAKANAIFQQANVTSCKFGFAEDGDMQMSCK